MQKRLKKLMDEYKQGLLKIYSEDIAAYLNKKGVFAPEFSAGDIVYIVVAGQSIAEKEVENIVIGKENYTINFTDESCYTIWDKNWSVGATYIFHSRKEAEAEIKRRREREL